MLLSPGILRAAPVAVNLPSVAPATDEHLRVTTNAQKEPRGILWLFDRIRIRRNSALNEILLATHSLPLAVVRGPRRSAVLASPRSPQAACSLQRYLRARSLAACFAVLWVKPSRWTAGSKSPRSPQKGAQQEKDETW